MVNSRHSLLLVARRWELSGATRHTLGFASQDGPFDFGQGRLRPSLHKLLQNATEIFPLSARFHLVDYMILMYVRVFLIDDIEIIRRTD